MARLLVDTDIFVDHLRGKERIRVAPADGAYSAITRAELYAGTRGDEESIDLLLGAFEEIAVTRAVAEAAGRIRRSTALTLPDALIAATAMLAGSVLVTRNIRDFGKVAGLEVDAR